MELRLDLTALHTIRFEHGDAAPHDLTNYDIRASLVRPHDRKTSTLQACCTIGLSNRRVLQSW